MKNAYLRRAKFYILLLSALLLQAQKCQDNVFNSSDLRRDAFGAFKKGELKEGLGYLTNPPGYEYGTTQCTFPQITIPGDLKRVESTGPDEMSFTPNDDEQLKQAMEALGGNPMAIQHANCFMNKNIDTKFKYGGSSKKSVKIGGKCKMIVSDYTLDKDSKRMFIIDKCKGSIKRMHAAHGSGRNKEGKSSGKISEAPDGIGNKSGDKRTPRGFLVIGGKHTEGNPSKVWYPGIKMHGLEAHNNTSHSRGILLHKAEYKSKSTGEVKPYVFDGDENDRSANGGVMKGVGGHSFGCSAIDPDAWDDMTANFLGDKASSANQNVESGPLMYNFGPIEASKGENYCGDSEWKK